MFIITTIRMVEPGTLMEITDHPGIPTELTGMVVEGIHSEELFILISGLIISIIIVSIKC